MAERYRKRPVEVEAMFWDGKEWDRLVAFAGGAVRRPESWPDDLVQVMTLEDADEVHTVHALRRGDWLIRGVNGEFYPCKPDIFAATYEPVDASER